MEVLYMLKYFVSIGPGNAVCEKRDTTGDATVVDTEVHWKVAREEESTNHTIVRCAAPGLNSGVQIL